MTKQIPLTQGQVAIVCDCHAHLVEGKKWHAVWSPKLKGYYAIHNFRGTLGKVEHLRMHRLINETPERLFTDHVNGNSLDNRCENLRTVTRSQNAMNRNKPSNNTSGHKGVFWSKQQKKWRAVIKVNGQKKYLGHFRSYADAVIVRKTAERLLFGVFGTEEDTERG